MGEVEEALAEMTAQFSRDARNPSAAIQLGIACMWLGRWNEAWQHFSEFIANSSGSTDIMQKFAGTARWCCGMPERAVDEWTRGLDADYTDASGGITIPLHLYFAALVCPRLTNVQEAQDRVRHALRANTTIEYPSLLGRVALGQLSVTDALREAAACDPHGASQHRFKVAFWDGVRRLAIDDKKEFSNQMNLVADLDWDDFDRNESDFIDRLWSSEFFLARHHRSDC